MHSLHTISKATFHPPAPLTTFFSNGFFNQHLETMWHIHKVYSFVHLIIKILLCFGYLWWIFTLDTNIFIICTYFQKSIHIPLTQTILSPAFQPYVFQIATHPLKPLTTGHGSLHIHTSGYLILDKVNCQMFCLNLLPLEDFLYHCPLGSLLSRPAIF